VHFEELSISGQKPSENYVTLRITMVAKYLREIPCSIYDVQSTHKRLLASRTQTNKICSFILLVHIDQRRTLGCQWGFEGRFRVGQAKSSGFPKREVHRVSYTTRCVCFAFVLLTLSHDQADPSPEPVKPTITNLFRPKCPQKRVLFDQTGDASNRG